MMLTAAAAAAADDDNLTERLHTLTPATDTSVQMTGYERLAGPEAAGVAVAPGPPGSFDAFSVGTPDVHFDGRIYRMWYCGSAVPCFYKGGESSIGLAISEDGVHWKRATAASLCSARASQALSMNFESRAVAHCTTKRKVSGGCGTPGCASRAPSRGQATGRAGFPPAGNADCASAWPPAATVSTDSVKTTASRSSTSARSVRPATCR